MEAFSHATQLSYKQIVCKKSDEQLWDRALDHDWQRLFHWYEPPFKLLITQLSLGQVPLVIDPCNALTLRLLPAAFVCVCLYYCLGTRSSSTSTASGS